METKKSEQKTTAVVKNSEIVDQVLQRVNEFQKFGELNLPDNYSPENALKSAYLILQEAKDKDGKPVLESCSKISIANTLLDMVVQGLSPMKKQCAFVAYGGKLTLVREYFGTIALAKRFGNVKDVTAGVIYKGDTFQYSVDAETGRKHIVKHEQEIENIDTNNIRGAYAVIMFNDGTTQLEVMNIAQIKQSWLQGHGNGATGAHKNFQDQMAVKTVINRACKPYINASDDEAVVPDDDEKDQFEERIQGDINENANKIKVDTSVEDVEPIQDDKPGNKHDTDQEPSPDNESDAGKQNSAQGKIGPDF